ncbi:MAG TPA: FG-GAP repeat protein [Myxococcota bacterium]|jgi:hypothetical protein|nr:FG-GAP repeat protein [Myxococcota bacterium]
MWWVFLACTAPDEASPSLAEVASRVVEGDLDKPYGDAVFDVGDVDGDGADDIGIAWASEGDLEGRAGNVDIYTLSGHVATITDAVSARWIVATGECSSPRVPGNLNVVPLGDLDGDGLGEVAVGHPHADNGVVAVYGGAQLVDGAFLGPHSAFWQIEPAAATWSFGSDLASGDIDGDAYTDLVVGAPITDAPLYGGEAYVLLGQDLRQATDIVAADEIGMRLATNLPGEHLGERVAILEDLDGDGLGEIALLASACSRDPEEGYVSVVPGSYYIGGGHRTTASLAKLYSEEPRLNLLSLGDADGDGLGDLAVGGAKDAEGQDSVLVLSGRTLSQGGEVEPPEHRFYTGGDSRSALTVWQVDGHTEVLGYDGGYLVRVAEPVWAEGWFKSESWTTPCPGDEVEPWRRQLAVGDFDGDGRDEIAFGEPGWPDCEELQPGAVFVIE